jgi:GTPase
MTNAREDFSLDAELGETTGWDLEDDLTDPADPGDPDDPDTDDPDTDDAEGDGWESGYAEDDPELTTGEQDLAERYALRRVAGLSTELEDISEVEYRQLRLERVVLVGV